MGVVENNFFVFDTDKNRWESWKTRNKIEMDDDFLKECGWYLYLFL